MDNSGKRASKAGGETPENKLVERAKDGDEEAFGALYDRYVDRVYRLVRLRVAHDMVAEDLTSETFLKAWDGLDGYQSRGYSFGAWLFRIARNLVIDHYRTKKTEEPLEAAEAEGELRGVAEAVERAELAQMLRGKLRALTDDQRAVLELKFLMGLNTEEVGQVLGKKEGAVRALQMRALQAMARITETAHD